MIVPHQIASCRYPGPVYTRDTTNVCYAHGLSRANSDARHSIQILSAQQSAVLNRHTGIAVWILTYPILIQN